MRLGKLAMALRFGAMFGLAIALLIEAGAGLKVNDARDLVQIGRDAWLLSTTALAAELPAPGAGTVIAIDPGHGGPEIGAEHVFPDGTTLLEKDLNLRVALRVADLLTKAGYRPVLTRRTDGHVNEPPKAVRGILPIGLADDLQARVDIANNAGARLFLAIHFNGNTYSGLQGPEIYYSEGRPFSADNQRFAKLVLQNLAGRLSGIGYQGSGVVRTDAQALGPGDHFYVLGPQGDPIVRPTAMPGVLAEGLFLTNAADAALLRDGRAIDTIALAYATAIHQFFAGSGTQLPTNQSSSTPGSASGAPAIGQGTVATDGGVGALMRAQPNTTGDIVQALSDGTTVDLLKLANGQEVVAGDTRWYRARYNGAEGYLYAELLQTAGGSQAASTQAQPSLGQGTITSLLGTGALLRAEPNTSSDVVRALPEGDSIDLLKLTNGETVIPSNSKWYLANYDGSQGYVYAALVQASNVPPPVAAASTVLGTATIQTIMGTGALLRAQPDTSSDIVNALPEGGSVDLLKLTTGEAVTPGDAKWYLAAYAGSQGYIYDTLVQRSQ